MSQKDQIKITVKQAAYPDKGEFKNALISDFFGLDMPNWKTRFWPSLIEFKRDLLTLSVLSENYSLGSCYDKYRTTSSKRWVVRKKPKVTHAKIIG